MPLLSCLFCRVHIKTDFYLDNKYVLVLEIKTNPQEPLARTLLLSLRSEPSLLMIIVQLYDICIYFIIKRPW
jgi:hypothetical protein